MTFDEYILNPMGKNNAVMNASMREIQRATYRKKFDNILLRESGKIEYYLYKDSKANTYWVHAKIPSELVKNFYYDVVLKFSAKADTKEAGTDLFKYDVQFYSNDPAYVYTYAHVFLKNNLFIKELASKMSKEALRKEAKEKNPGNNVGYVKTLYFAYLLMDNKKLNKVSRFENEAKPLDPRYLLSQIEDADTKIKDRQEKGAKVSTRKKIEVDQGTYNSMKKYLKPGSAGTERLAVRVTGSIGTIQNKASERLKTTKTVKSVKRK